MLMLRILEKKQRIIITQILFMMVWMRVIHMAQYGDGEGCTTQLYFGTLARAKIAAERSITTEIRKQTAETLRR